jgi:hypothetical protein
MDLEMIQALEFDVLARGLARVRAEEREECAKQADEFRTSWVNTQGKNCDGAVACESLAIQIRARGAP